MESKADGATGMAGISIRQTGIPVIGQKNIWRARYPACGFKGNPKGAVTNLEKAASEDGGKNKKLVKEARKLLSLPADLVTGPTEYNKDPQSLIQYRNEIGELLDNLYSK